MPAVNVISRPVATAKPAATVTGATSSTHTANSPAVTSSASGRDRGAGNSRSPATDVTKEPTAFRPATLLIDDATNTVPMRQRHMMAKYCTEFLHGQGTGGRSSSPARAEHRQPAGDRRLSAAEVRVVPGPVRGCGVPGAHHALLLPVVTGNRAVVENPDASMLVAAVIGGSRAVWHQSLQQSVRKALNAALHGLSPFSGIPNGPGRPVFWISGNVCPGSGGRRRTTTSGQWVGLAWAPPRSVGRRPPERRAGRLPRSAPIGPMVRPDWAGAPVAS
jgi:hypothetical protein